MKLDVQLITPTDGSNINGILSDFRWLAEPGDILVIEYSFYDSDSDFFLDDRSGYDSNDADYDLPFREGFRTFSEAERALVRQIFAELENVIDVDFVEVADSLDSEIRLGFTDLAAENADGVAFLPSAKYFPFDIDVNDVHESWELSGDIWIDINTPELGLQEVIIHEIGHALGLSHPFESGFEVYEDVAAEILDGTLDYVGNTVLSYQPVPVTVSASEVIYASLASTFMLLDVEALQHIYGVAPTDIDNDIYIIRDFQDDKPDISALGYEGFQEHDYINGYVAITDGGGNNVLVVSVDERLEIDLSQGGWNYTAGGYLTSSVDDLNLHFGEDTVWDDIYTAGGADLILANDRDNVIRTNVGADTVYGGAGDDTVSLGSHSDSYFYDSGNDVISGGLGFDTVDLGELSYAFFKFYLNGESSTLIEIAGNTVIELNSVERLVFADRQFILASFHADISLANGDFIVDHDVPLYLTDIGTEDGVIDNVAARLYRLYYGGLGRAPDEAGFDFWLDRVETGSFSFTEVADRFIESPEFFDLADVNGNGRLTDEEFLDHMYFNVLGRPPDVAGYDWWLDQLDDRDQTQAEAFSNMVQSDEFVLITAATVNEFLFV